MDELDYTILALVYVCKYYPIGFTISKDLYSIIELDYTNITLDKLRLLRRRSLIDKQFEITEYGEALIELVDLRSIVDNILCSSILLKRIKYLVIRHLLHCTINQKNVLWFISHPNVAIVEYSKENLFKLRREYEY